MAEAKTRVTGTSVKAFIATVEPPARRAEAEVLDALFRRVTGEAPRMWGPSIIGYGEYRSTYESGREVHWMRSGFSPRKAKHSLYLQGGYCDDMAAAGGPKAGPAGQAQHRQELPLCQQARRHRPCRARGDHRRRLEAMRRLFPEG